MWLKNLIKTYGKLLTIVLILLTSLQILAVLDLLNIFSFTKERENYGFFGTTVGKLINLIVTTLTLLGLLNWKKWAVYLWFLWYLVPLMLFVPNMVQAYTPLFQNYGPTGDISVVLLAGITFLWAPALLWIAIKRKWQYFK